MDKLQKLQKELKVNKGQYNSFGKYNFRSLEDILEALKKIETDLVPTSMTEPIQVGNKIFIKATVMLTDKADPEKMYFSEAYTELPDSRKGMAAEQNTGACISYALKYSWGQLLCLDDTKDADTRAPSDNVEDKKKLESDVLNAIMAMEENARQAFVAKHKVKSADIPKYSIDELKELLVLAGK